MRSPGTLLTRTQTVTGKRSPGLNGPLVLVVVGILLITLLITGCSHTDEGTLTREATTFFNQGNYGAALDKYAQLIRTYPESEDRVLFEMGVIYAYPKNGQKDYRKALDCFQRLVNEHPDSEYRHDSQMMILQIHNVILKDQQLAAQEATLEASRQEVKSKAGAIVNLQEEIETLEEEVVRLSLELIDKVLIEKKARRLTLLSKGEAIKTYKIALGGNPVGPKERQGDLKTPEGTYIIDARNGNSGFHLSLHISYPNEQDKKRARELGVSPGGDIMIHGLKNGYGEMGASHAGVDWTEGCIAVTNQEMEEIYKFVPNGTVVEITP